MAVLPMRLDAEGDLEVIRSEMSHLGMFLEDCAALDWHGRALAGIAAVRSGAAPHYQCTLNAVRLVVTPQGGSFQIAANLTRNAPVPIDLDELEENLRAVRDLLAARPPQE